EGAERLSTIERAGDVAVRATFGDVRQRLLPSTIAAIEQRLAAAHDVGNGTLLDWCNGFDPITGKPVLLPAASSVKRPHADPLTVPGAASSTGVAAGPSPAEAQLRAQSELAERDAAALWWLAGRRGRPLAPDQSAAAVGEALITRLRCGSAQRQTWLMDIT